MSGHKVHDEAQRWTMAAATLVRWLRAADPNPVLTRAQASALAVIVHAGEITPSQLAALEEVARPTMARTVSQLEKLSMIQRIASTHDGRSAILSATPIGRATIHDGHARRTAPLAAAMGELTAEEREALSSALPVLEEILRREIPGR
ncbi:MarR family winged helix-turn-helix transcriptional regulator [Nonomuraea aurantiaca]|uniref:MarR family winged helix-turn-helix transcriptional regulator n=1 Tax=Nonomuraea aurantiaca TaxID=2878562 RepID=UPI001CD9A86D|nr:MarR family transcriptional regulator [Nonomuraea aurantiaca]MCA2228453.1 MarR family transcriptional regulator [Nonomuraea aurantiaca]